MTDIESLEGMVAYWASLGENLPRSRNELVRDIGSFAVAEHHGEVTGCASLLCVWLGLAEIRSLGVEAGWQGQGQGTAIVQQFLVEKAPQMAIKKVLCWLYLSSSWSMIFISTSEIATREGTRGKIATSVLVKCMWWSERSEFAEQIIAKVNVA